MTLYTLSTGHLCKAQEMQNLPWWGEKKKMQYWIQTFSLEKKNTEVAEDNSGILQFAHFNSSN